MIRRAGCAAGTNFMQLIQILLPLTDNHSNPLPAGLYASIKKELTQKFGGITTYANVPAEGRWKSNGEEIHEPIVVYEVMVDGVEKSWWKDYRTKLEAHFRQEEIIIRALPMQQL